ncbi:hypothetical protein BSKO_02386 [Bryopsis sp. KO-2023]|nr:hypothetical protein BSKO_02386 [Bryopsis sp. KO-2023]
MLSCAEEQAKEGDLIVAIDFGTSRSAVAYTIFEGEDELVNVLKVSGASSYVQGDFKTPTSALIEDGEVRAFGFDAERRFVEEERESSAGWMLFKWFKMNLHNPGERDPLVECFGGGENMRLSGILEKCLKYVKDDVLAQLKLSGVIHTEDAHKLFWVLTVPAIWSDHARYVMRMAAFKAGLIPSEQSCHLFLALEPECAAIASQSDPIQKRLWALGSKFLIADCGGGTLDITSHEVVQTSPLKLRELAQPVGGPFGATQVDEKFLEFFEDLVGMENFERLRREGASEYLDLRKEWEERKVMFRFDRSNSRWTRVPVLNAVAAMGIEAEFGSMVDAWNERNPNRVVEKLSRRIKLSLSFDLMASFFEDVVSSIVDQIGDAVHASPEIDCVVMAGGFSRCALLQAKVRERFAPTSVDVIVANNPDLLIVKGAAMFGARPSDLIETRKSRFTFGISAIREYNSSDVELRRFEDKSFLCNSGKRWLDMFSVHVRAGDNIDETDGNRRQCYGPLYRHQTSCTVPILITRERYVSHPQEEGVRELASISIPFNKALPFEDRTIWVEFLFGGTEVRCLIFDAKGENQIGSAPIRFNFF